jgi:Family of unknown function (DUF6868)
MTTETITAVFGWMSVLNIGYLAFSTLMLIVFRGTATGLHQSLFSLEEKDVHQAYFTWLGNYKIFTLIFSLAPYLALRIVQ